MSIFSQVANVIQQRQQQEIVQQKFINSMIKITADGVFYPEGTEQGQEDKIAQNTESEETRESEDIFVDKILPYSLDIEGGKTTDHRGDTNFGWSQPTYDEYMKSKGLPTKSVFNLKREEAIEGFRDKFYITPNIDKIPDYDVQSAVFDFYINAQSTAIKRLQTIVGTDSDGKMGPKTLKKVTEYIKNNGKDVLIDNLLTERENHYKKLIKNDPATYKQYENGWKRRIKEQRQKFNVVK